MRVKSLFISCFFTAALLPGACAAELFSKPAAYGLGLQRPLAGWGIGGSADISGNTAAQAVFGPFGSLRVFAVRGLYRFHRAMDWDVYAFGQAARLTHRPGGRRESESVLNLGGGIGLEYDWRRNFPAFIPLLWSLEVGFSAGDLEHKNVAGLRLGAGVHYRF